MTTPPYYGMYRPSSHSLYESEITFVETPEKIISERIFFIEFTDPFSKKGYYRDDKSGYLNKLYIQHLKDKNKSLGYSGDFSDPDIGSIQSTLRNYAYIKVISDPQAPDRNGNYYVLPFGQKIFNIIDNFIIENIPFGNQRNNAIMYERTFIFNVRPMQVSFGGPRFPNYDSCHFTNKVCDHEYETANKIGEIIKHPVYKPPVKFLRETRRKKIEEIFSKNPI